LPGCFTATEAFAALAAGADGLKIFPADIGGPRLIAGLRAVLPCDTPLCAVGGIGPGELEAFWTAGCRGFGIGSALYAPGDDAAAVTAKAAALAEAARRLAGVALRRERP
jgi:2-dehydro-3-deoxyphosphogalactonate aldolase